MPAYDDDRLERTITLRAGDTELEGTLGVPADAKGIVLFAHGSGSSRFSSRNRYVARVLRDAGEKPSAAVMERVRSTLLAAAEGDDTDRAQLREGTLTEDLSAAVFGLVQPLRALSSPK